MLPKTYIETTVVSYLTARPSRDVVLAGHQQVTTEWWAERSSYELFASQLVLDEAARGDSEAAEHRLKALDGIPLLDLSPEAVALGSSLLAHGGLPQTARVDALHVALATAHGMDCLLTWNCKHIANAMLRGKIESICRAEGYEPPVICTPIEFTGDES